jgi:glycosyltransferase involved in cell wall biosynthesis
MNPNMNSKKARYSVCHLLFEYFPFDPRVRRYVNALTEKEIPSIIICSKSKGSKYFEKYKDNLIYRIPVSKHRQSFILTTFEYLTFTFLSAPLLIYLGIKHRVKIIHVHTLPDFLIFAGIFNKAFSVKLILDLHELFPEVFIARRPHLEKTIFVKILEFQEKISMKLADLVITIHEPAMQIFINRHKDLKNKLHIIMNGVDPLEFKDTKLKKTDKFIIIYHGTLVKIWNLPLIISSLNILKDKMPNEDYEKIVFKIYGLGPVLNDLILFAKKLNVSDRISYEGSLPPDEMYKEVLKANVCILPALKNIYTDLFYTIKLTEMVFLKIPVIATRLNTYKYYYREDSLFYFDSGDKEQLAERILDVYYNEKLVAQKVNNAFEDYEKVKWEKMKEKYLDIINGLMK